MKTGETKEEKEEEVTEETEEAKAMRFAKEIEQEAKGEEVEEKKEEEVEEKEKTAVPNEEKERQLAMMNNRTKRLYERMEENASKKQKRIDTLKEKAKKANAKSGDN